MADEERAKPSHAARRQERHRQAALRQAGAAQALNDTDENPLQRTIDELSTQMKKLHLHVDARMSALEHRVADVLRAMPLFGGGLI